MTRMPTVLNAAPLAGLALRCQPDARLVKLYREGHDRAFDEIVRRYREALVSFAGRIVPTHRAEDVVQESLTKAHAALVASVAEIKLRPWLYAIVRNRALNDLRDEPDHRRLAGDLDGVPQPPEVAAGRAELAYLLTRVKGLPRAQREALLKRELEGRSHAEIASMLGVTPGAVRGLIFRARSSLRDGAGLLIPMPALRALLEAGPMQVESAGAGVGGAAAGLTAGGGGGVAIKAGAALLVAGLAVGPGIALRDHGRGRDTASAAVARHGHAGPADGRSGPARSADGSREAGSGDGRNSGHGPGSSDGSGRGPGGQPGDSSRGPGPSGEGDGTGGRRAGEGHGDGHEPEPATEDGGSGHDGGDRGGESPEHGGSGTSGHGGSSGSGDGGSGSGDSGSGSSGSGSGSSGSDASGTGSSGSGSDGSGTGSDSSGSGDGSSDSTFEPASSDAGA
jgi:RNA polymerase sigma factor (sigma-70 family)